MSIGVRIDLGDIDREMDQIAVEAETAVRPAARAGALVLYEEAKRNVAKLGKKTGNLASAIYHAFNDGESTKTHATYTVSWNASKAPHGNLVEWGHLQRYVTYVGKDGKFHTAIRPSKRGTPKPRRRASQAEKDAYYVPLAQPRQIPPAAFMRGAILKFPEARQAMVERYFEVLEEKGVL